MYDAPGHHPAKLGPGCPGVRSQSLAVIHAIVCGYLLPVRWRLRSCLTAPREAQAARPPGTAPRCSRHASGPPPSPPPLSCRLLPPPGAGRNPPQRPVGQLPAGHPRFATHRPAVIITTSRTALLKLPQAPPHGAFALRAACGWLPSLRSVPPRRPRLRSGLRSPPPPPAPPASASCASQRSLASLVHSFGLFVLRLYALACVSERPEAWSCRLRSRQGDPPKQNRHGCPRFCSGTLP